MIGLDFGTTNSCAAYGGDYPGEVRTASVAPLNTPPYDTVLGSSVLDPMGPEPRLGIQAEEAYRVLPASERSNPLRLLSNFKPYLNNGRLLKRIREIDQTSRFYDGLQQVDVEQHTYKDVWVGEGFPRAHLVEAVALLLQRLLDGAVDSGATLDRLLLGTPVAFSSRARKRMVAALFATGRFESYREIIEKTRFVPEPVAAAAMGMREAFDPREHERVVVFDHGGGTLDLSIVEFEYRSGEHEFPVPKRELAPPSGENGVAGKAFDEALKSELCSSGKIRRELESLGEALALRIVRDAKEQLSIHEEARLALFENEGDEGLVSRAKLEIASKPLLGQIEQQMLRLLDDAGIDPGEVDRVLMTGGSSLIPCVQQTVRGLFPALSEEGRIRAYDPADPGDVERAVTEIAQGLALLGEEQSDFRRAVIWDVELLDSEGQGFRPVAARGDNYEVDEEGRPELRKVIPIEDTNHDGMALGVWESRLDKHSFLFGIAEVPAGAGELQLEVTLRPDSLYPTLRVLDANGEQLERESEFGWPANRAVAADIGILTEGQLAEFFDQDEVDYLPTAPFGSFRHAPLTRFIGVGDQIEWVEHRSDGRPPLSRAGEVIGIREIGSHDPLSEVPDFVLAKYELQVRENEGGRVPVSPEFGTVRIRPVT
jgi:molecular chaperone DnaK (HSP70)